MQKPINFNDIAIAFIKGDDYRILFWYMSNNDAINIVKSSKFKKEDYYNVFCYI